MRRQAVDPTQWGLTYEMHQAEVVTGATRHLRASGQVDLVEDADAPMGLRVTSPGDIRQQLMAALDNVEKVLVTGGMERSDLVFVRFYTTDIDAFLDNYDVYAKWISPAGIRPPQSLLGVAALVHPDLMVEIEVEAAV